MKSAVAHGLTLGGWLALLALVVYWNSWWHPSAYFPRSLVLLVAAFPMLIPLRGLLHGRPRAHLWASLLAIPYFMHGIVESYATPPERIPALLEVALSVTVVVAAAFYFRWTSPQDPR
jgi:uncharacterized membrane protein